MSAGYAVKAATLASVLSFTPALAFENLDVTAKYVMSHMKPDERFPFIAGVVEGLAYARYARDNKDVPADKKMTGSMECIYDWFYKDNRKTMDLIYAALDRYGDYTPGAVIAVLQKKACGD